MKIAIVSAYFSEGMGYVENCLPKALVTLGHDVHVITSNLNVYGNSPDYERTYGAFLGPADQGTGSKVLEGYTLHRLGSRQIAGYVWLNGLAAKIGEIDPDIVHCTEVASLQSFLLAALRLVNRFRYFTETHQHMSVMKPFMKLPRGRLLKKAGYRLTRTLPTWLASFAVERCYAIAPDCVEVVTRFYGVPLAKTKLQSLGTDTELFRPAQTPNELASRTGLRTRHGYGAEDVVCIYTGRFSVDKNPLVLARAVARLAERNPSFHALFIGEGPQRDEIARCRNARIHPFVKYVSLAEIYSMSDIAVWPRQESMSMLDAAACGLPLVVADTIGERERVEGNGRLYRENDVDDLVFVLESLVSLAERATLGRVGRAKMVKDYSWTIIARSIAQDYAHVLGGGRLRTNVQTVP